MTGSTSSRIPAAPPVELPARMERQSSHGDHMPRTEHGTMRREAIDGEAFREGDDESFRAVLDRFGPLIRKVVWSYADSDDDREDLYQEVCIRILEQRGKYREQGAMGGWIGTVARNMARNWRAARSAHESAKDRYAIAVVPIEAARRIAEDPSRLLNYREYLSNVKQALDSLPAAQATAYRLVHIEGHSPKEAGRILKVATATVRSNVRHAREKLREQLAELKDELS